MHLTDSYELYTALERLNLLENTQPLWWPKHGTFEVVVGAILTQNTQWSRVVTSLENLSHSGYLSLEALCHIDPETLMELIRPSGLIKAKAKNIILLCNAITESFGSFEAFALEVDREWLLAQKGIGPESADAILCYACLRDAMVVDSYTARLLRAFGYEFEGYDELQEWCEAGIREHFDASTLQQTFARFHGMIVEYVKGNSKGKVVNVERINSTI
ncbi:MAG: 3-methyladenine DNA glycosylase [Sulfuricurvum sp.]|uniref:3-methyladenine DNA glycosylase n=1 Tax=Sulfuricurvum sp. TaxID=2025608 RepID=UPI002625826B|nr:3-methyladenine DNA glycosylase [Sulfuricurvum sp.]MDD2828469.1 3-methyladenine DNA glycosylase [Sulfuricurvum sp.]MDD4949000.1 3-methyladenine DNA glycosylase [Sulfuricurvum sp.]